MSNHSLIQKIINNNDLSREEIKNLLIEIINDDDEGYKFLAFSTALLTKGETNHELLGIIDALNYFCQINIKLFPKNIIDISSSGGGVFKKLNISTLSSLIISNLNLPVAKQSFWGITSTSGSADVLNDIGLDVTKINLEKLKNSLYNIGIGYYHHLFMFNNLKNLVNFGILLNKKNIGVNTPFNLIAPIYTPIKLKYRMFGVNNIKNIEVVFKLFHELEYTNFLILHGKGGIDEAANFTDTLIKGRINGETIEKELTPKDFGLKKVPYDSVKPVNSKSNTIDFLKIIYGIEKGAKLDMVLMNAALGLYTSAQVSNLNDGIALSLEEIKSGRVRQKFEKLIINYGNISTLKNLLEKYVI